MYCANCGAVVQAGAKFCTNCGASQERTNTAPPGWEQNADQRYTPPIYVQTPVYVQQSTYMQRGELKNKWVSFLLCFFFGAIGAHKFYEGKIGMGILYLFTLGLFGIGILVDLIKILLKPDTYYFPT